MNITPSVPILQAKQESNMDEVECGSPPDDHPPGIFFIQQKSWESEESNSEFETPLSTDTKAKPTLWNLHQKSVSFISAVFKFSSSSPMLERTIFSPFEPVADKSNSSSLENSLPIPPTIKSNHITTISNSANDYNNPYFESIDSENDLLLPYSTDITREGPHFSLSSLSSSSVQDSTISLTNTIIGTGALR